MLSMGQVRLAIKLFVKSSTKFTRNKSDCDVFKGRQTYADDENKKSPLGVRVADIFFDVHFVDITNIDTVE